MLPTKFQFIWEREFQRKRLFYGSTNQKKELSVAVMFINGLERNEQSLQRTFQGCFLPNFDSFGQVVSEQKIFQKSTNLTQDLPVVAMFVNGSEQNDQSLQKTFHGCFLPSFGSFGQVVAEEKIFQKSTNHEQELPVAAMLVNGSGQNMHSLQWTFHRCSLPSFSSFG